MEAFDDDASGYVKIKEVNDFTDAIPKGWTLLQWLSYWAAGRHNVEGAFSITYLEYGRLGG
jgi:hypothetical protein